MQGYLGVDYSWDLFQKYEKFGMNSHNMIYDRSEQIPHYLKISNYIHPMPARVENYNTSFFELTEQRAKQLLATGKHINVMWSGGIDSTYILLALMHFANDLDQIKVYGTYNSIIESGDMFDRRIKDKLQYIIKPASYQAFNYKEFDGLYVSGMCGNQLFGPTDDFFANGNTAMFHHTLGTPTTIYEDYRKHINPELLEFLQPAIDVSPRPIETVADLRWYCIFNLDWYTAVYEHRTHVGAERAERVLGFFDTEEFQTWAVSTKEPFTKIKGDPNTHRWQMREVMSELFGEPDFAKNKTKKISSFSALDPMWVFLYHDYENGFLNK
jgi:hypothetical protein